MYNQYDVARMLNRTPVEEMHKLLDDFEPMVAVQTWYQFVRCKETEQFLLSYGWTLKEYAKECAKCTDEEQRMKQYKRYFVSAYA